MRVGGIAVTPPSNGRNESTLPSSAQGMRQSPVTIKRISRGAKSKRYRFSSAFPSSLPSLPDFVPTDDHLVVPSLNLSMKKKAQQQRSLQRTPLSRRLYRPNTNGLVRSLFMEDDDDETDDSKVEVDPTLIERLSLQNGASPARGGGNHSPALVRTPGAFPLRPRSRAAATAAATEGHQQQPRSSMIMIFPRRILLPDLPSP